VTILYTGRLEQTGHIDKNGRDNILKTAIKTSKGMIPRNVSRKVCFQEAWLIELVQNRIQWVRLEVAFGMQCVSACFSFIPWCISLF